MDKKPEKENQSSHSPSQSRNSGGAYYELEPKKTKKNFLPLILGGVLLAALAGGLYVSKKSGLVGQDAQEKVQMSESQAFVTSLLAITDDNKDPEAQKMAATAIKKHLEQKKEQKSAPQIESEKEKEKEKEKVEEVKPLPAAQLGFFKGILTQCGITGHDVHWINETGIILDHVEHSTPLDANATLAREFLSANRGRVVVVVYEKGYEIYDSSGKLIRTSQP